MFLILTRFVQIHQSVGDEMDYEWTSRLRYYWEEGTLRVCTIHDSSIIINSSMID